MATNIKYVAKKTSANTEYRSISISDKKFLLKKLFDVQQILSQIDQNEEEDVQVRIFKERFSRPNTELPYQTMANKIGKYAENSLSSFIDGVLSNMASGKQKDPSAKTCAGLEIVFRELNEFGLTDSIKFTKVSKLPEICYEKTTFSNMFDIIR